MVRGTKKGVGRKNTTIRAIPKALYKKILSVKLEMEIQQKNNKKPKKITLLEAGLEVARRIK